MVYKREKSANMLLKFVFVLLGVFWSIHSIAAERMQLTCDELGIASNYFRLLFHETIATERIHLIPFQVYIIRGRIMV